MAVVVGINFAIALRLLGWIPQFHLNSVKSFYRVHWLGVYAVFLSGAGLLLAYPAKALTNPVFYLKFITLTIGLILADWLQRKITDSSIADLSPKKIKAVAATSIMLWIITITAGRFLAYTHSVLLASRFF
ncbi:MAG: hypothetical protein CMQ41_01955 [Gammaproteobacteria bacterium]|nr:hypothetical protein [Gammaproteobacteria bacterium]